MAPGQLSRLLASAALAIGLIAAPAPAQLPYAPSVVHAASLPRWTGSIDLYRVGTFSTQGTYLWCTAADVQIARNIVRDQSDHNRADQSRYFDSMRARNRYDIPLKDGIDPQGWAAGMRNFVDGRYRLATFRSYTPALRSAVTSLRLTNLPVGVLVARGGHAWLLTGFSATADPAVTRDFTVTSVRVVGPLYGLQSRNGYDMPPDTNLSASAFKRFFTPWHYAGVRMVWEGLYGTVQGAPADAAPVSQAARSLQPPVPGLARPMPSQAASSDHAAPGQTAGAADPAGASAAAGVAQPGTSSQPVPALTVTTGTSWPLVALLLGGTAIVLGAIGLAGRLRRRRGAGRLEPVRVGPGPLARPREHPPGESDFA
jgi:hypothetical protein